MLLLHYASAFHCSTLFFDNSFFLSLISVKVPPPGRGSLYIRPLLIGSGPILGLGPAPEYTFLIYASPVGNYFKVSLSPLPTRVLCLLFCVSDHFLVIVFSECRKAWHHWTCTLRISTIVRLLVAPVVLRPYPITHLYAHNKLINNCWYICTLLASSTLCLFLFRCWKLKQEQRRKDFPTYCTSTRWTGKI